ncbi:hypothetical protein LTR62_006269 [Meristemomyces frigidus]|uniref:CENP-V/GFA domain-containing protein n=1 Tax=Meristemomyces frigidus TaxID=1508187 RepID=A0AAN7YEP5_9PEZI|nr:hypothetical protein LTR62_006269 [Meristemomyces frigidus]
MSLQTATQTCFCGATKLEFPVDGIEDVFVCHCLDCRKLTASMFATNFCMKDVNIKYLKGGDKLKQVAQSASIASGNSMKDSRCGECGTLMNRQSSGFPGLSFLRVGEVDQLDVLLAGKFKPRVEQFMGSKAPWIGEIEAERRAEGQFDFTA